MSRSGHRGVRYIATLALLAVIALSLSPSQALTRPVTVGSKAFTESHILAELTAQLLEAGGYEVQRKLGLGGTMVAYQALRQGAVDIYPEYTGTLAQAILQQPHLERTKLATALAELDLQLLLAFGFSNSYAMAVAADTATALQLEQVSDLAQHPGLKLGFSLEFLHRDDGWPSLRARYLLPQEAVGIEHALAYAAIASGQLDVTDAYTTDGELTTFELVLLADDKQFFGNYDAVLLARTDLPAPVKQRLSALQGRLDASTMRELNRQVSTDQLKPAQVAANFLRDQGLVAAGAEPPGASGTGRASRIGHNIAVHLQLTLSALLLACALAIPLALLVAPHKRLAQTLIYVASLLQTIPSLALLALLIPVLGLGKLPAIFALFLYSLLPIVRNTLTGLFDVDPLLTKVAVGMGLTRSQQLRAIELPLALPTILAGIKTAAIISIGTATLAAFVGAGGLGEPIITGLTLNDHGLILEGAIPAALLAITAELLFEFLERRLLPAYRRDSAA